MRSAALKIPRPKTHSGGPPFSQSGMKLHWARCHAHNLSTFWERCVDVHYAAATGQEMDLPYEIEETLLQPPIFPEIPLILGDCIRNLRSSLDYLVSEMARATGSKDTKTLFPFAENPADLKASFNARVPGDKHRKGRKAGALYDLCRKYPNLGSIVMDTIQPYSRDYGANPMGDMLWRIITSDNIDKHRLMTPSIQRIGVKDILLSEGSSIVGEGMMTGNCINFGPGVRLDPDSDFSIDMVFADPARLAGRSVMSTLVEGCNMVGEVIEIFRREFGSSVGKSAEE